MVFISADIFFWKFEIPKSIKIQQILLLLYVL